MASILMKNIEKTYEDGTTVIENLNLEIADNEFIVFVGPSGCGKSTTLRMMAGLEEITDGELYIGNKLMNNVSPKNRDIAMVFQNYALYPHMTVYKNMAFGLKNRGLPKKVIDAKVKDAAKMLEIENLLHRKPKALSGGQRQRVALGRAIVREPSVFLLDEPLSNLDAKLRTETRNRITMLHKELETTFVYVTHDQTEAMTMGDRIVVMKDGIIQQFDTPKEIYYHPKNIFVAGFIGTPQMNFIDCKIIRSKTGLCASFDKFHLEIPQKYNEKLSVYDDKEVVIGIRPEDVDIVENNKNVDNNGIVDAYVELVEMTGSDCFVYGKIGKNNITSKTSNEIKIKSNQMCYMRINTNKIHVFDKINENLICD